MGYDWEASTLRVGLFGGEPCPPGLKAEIERRMHIVCTDNYGLTEVMGPGVSGECLAERDHAAHRRGSLPVGGRRSRNRRAGGRGRDGGARAHAPLQAGHSRAALPHPRPDAPCTPSPAPAAARWRVWTRCAPAPTTCSSSAAPTCSPRRSRTCSRASRSVTPHYHIIVETRGGMDVLIVETELRPRPSATPSRPMDALRARIAEKLKGTLLVAPEVQPGRARRHRARHRQGQARRRPAREVARF